MKHIVKPLLCVVSIQLACCNNDTSLPKGMSKEATQRIQSMKLTKVSVDRADPLLNEILTKYTKGKGGESLEQTSALDNIGLSNNLETLVKIWSNELEDNKFLKVKLHQPLSYENKIYVVRGAKLAFNMYNSDTAFVDEEKNGKIISTFYFKQKNGVKK